MSCGVSWMLWRSKDFQRKNPRSIDLDNPKYLRDNPKYLRAVFEKWPCSDNPNHHATAECIHFK